VAFDRRPALPRGLLAGDLGAVRADPVARLGNPVRFADVVHVGQRDGSIVPLWPARKAVGHMQLFLQRRGRGLSTQLRITTGVPKRNREDEGDDHGGEEDDDLPQGFPSLDGRCRA
jgi:hypothetical protein